MKINRLINQPFVHPDIADDYSDRLFIKAMLGFELAIIALKNTITLYLRVYLVASNRH